MNQSPAISVLMPVYNGEQFLAAAIDSILAQTFTDFEFIIINDGSTDRSEEIISSYSDPRIRYVKNETNLRIIATLNKGITLAKGKYIARMDADDISFPGRFAAQFAFMEAHPDCGLCGTTIEVAPQFRQSIQSWVKTGSPDFMRFCLLFNNPFCHPTVFIRSSVLQTHHLSFKPDDLHAEEYALWIAIAAHAQIHNIEEQFLFYRMHEGQVTVKHKPLQLQTVRRIKTEMFRKLTLFHSAKTEAVHLLLTSEWFEGEYPSCAEILLIFEKTRYFDSIRNIFSLWRWIWSMKFSLLLRPSQRNQYLVKWIAEVRRAAVIKTQQRSGRKIK